MSKPRQTPMTKEAASRIQRYVDKNQNPSPQQASFKARAASAAAKKPAR